MFYVSSRMTTPPPVFSSPLQQSVYELLAKLEIAFERVDTDPGITMEDCQNINSGIGGRIVKTIFLCNRQQKFYNSNYLIFGKRLICATSYRCN